MTKTLASIIANTTRQTLLDDARTLADAELSRTHPGSASTALALASGDERSDLVGALWSEMDKVIVASTWVDASVG